VRLPPIPIQGRVWPFSAAWLIVYVDHKAGFLFRHGVSRIALRDRRYVVPDVSAESLKMNRLLSSD
jgi:hypothetical protein